MSETTSRRTPLQTLFVSNFQLRVPNYSTKSHTTTEKAGAKEGIIRTIYSAMLPLIKPHTRASSGVLENVAMYREMQEELLGCSTDMKVQT